MLKVYNTRRFFARKIWFLHKRWGYKGYGAERYPPVTALPCQPSLCKGAKGTGDADCHSQCAHWLRNDRGVTRGAVRNRRADRGVRPYGM